MVMAFAVAIICVVYFICPCVNSAKVFIEKVTLNVSYLNVWLWLQVYDMNKQLTDWVISIFMCKNTAVEQDGL